MENRHSEKLIRQIGDGTWYKSFNYYYQNEQEIDESFTTVEGCQNMIDYYEALRSSEEYSIISMDSPYIYIKENDIKKYFGSKSYFDFQGRLKK